MDEIRRARYATLRGVLLPYTPGGCGGGRGQRGGHLLDRDSAAGLGGGQDARGGARARRRGGVHGAAPPGHHGREPDDTRCCEGGDVLVVYGSRRPSSTPKPSCWPVGAPVRERTAVVGRSIDYASQTRNRHRFRCVTGPGRARRPARHGCGARSERCASPPATTRNTRSSAIPAPPRTTGSGACSRNCRAAQSSSHWDPRFGYLRSLLQALDIDADSQVLVFSRTSLQVEHITRPTPRAVYFNDDTYVGYVQNSPLIEFATIDARRARCSMPSRTSKDGPPTHMQREGGRCLTCHDTFSMMGGGVPRLMVLSAPVDDPADTRTYSSGGRNRRSHAAGRALGWLVCHRPHRHADPFRQPAAARRAVPATACVNCAASA